MWGVAADARNFLIKMIQKTEIRNNFGVGIASAKNSFAKLQQKPKLGGILE